MASSFLLTFAVLVLAAVAHRGSMKAGSFDLTITVVPDSGTDQLTGISGKFSIEIKDGKHFYSFDYNLPAD